MPTPPLRRKNPAVSIRRVQSERKYLTTWGSTPLNATWKYKFDYARRTVIIPPMGAQPRMIGTSQGMLGRSVVGVRFPAVTHSRSEAHLQPLILVAPPLIVGAYPPPHLELPGGGPPAPRAPVTEEEILANERLASFLTDETPPHRPTSLLSYPESHLYESLISQISDISRDDISINNHGEGIYQKIATGLTGSTEWSDSSSSSCGGSASLDFDFKKCLDSKPSSQNTNVTKTTNEKYLNIRNGKKEDEIKCPTCVRLSSRKIEDTSKKCPVGKWTQNFCTFEDITTQDEKHTDPVNCTETPKNGYQSENETKKQRKPSILRRSFVSTIHRNCSRSYLKSIFSTKKKRDNTQNGGPSSAIPAVVSIVHTNKEESGGSSSSVRELACYKCEGSLPSKSHSEQCPVSSLPSSKLKTGDRCKSSTRSGLTKKFHSLDFTRGKALVRTDSFLFKHAKTSNLEAYLRKSHCQRSPIIQPTVELLESLSDQSSFTPMKSYGNDKSIQVSSEDIARTQNGHGEISTLDPLRPSTYHSESSIECCTSCQQCPKQGTKNGGNASLPRNAKDGKCFLIGSEHQTAHSKPLSMDEITPLIVDFGIESSSSEEDVGKTVQFHSSPDLLAKKKPRNNSFTAYSPSLEFCSIATTNRDSFVCVYRSTPKSNDKSSGGSSSDYGNRAYSIRILRKKENANKKRGGSSGLGSSGSESSCEDDLCHHDTRNSSRVRKSSVAFLEPVFRSSFGSSSSSSLSSLKSTKGRLSFDYSWSWSHLNELVRRKPASGSTNKNREVARGQGSFRLPPNFTGISSVPLRVRSHRSYVV